MLPNELLERLQARVADCQQLANHMEPAFPVVPCSLFTGRRAAGLAFGYEHRIAINGVLLAENPEPMLRDTVAHEFAHVLVWWRYLQQLRTAPGGTVKPPPGHGSEWQGVMRHVFTVEPSRCHAFDTRNTGARSQRRWSYRCSCQPHLISTAKHRRVLSGARYVCFACKGDLVWDAQTQTAQGPLHAGSSVSSTTPRHRPVFD